MSWSLDPSEVFVFEGGSYSKRHGSPADTQRTPSVQLIHLPTGIQVSLSAATGHYSRKEAKRIRQQLKAERFAELERLVAKQLRIPGR